MKSEAKGEQIILCTWVFQCKRNPAGEIIKCNARICLRGNLMANCAESKAPAVWWRTICFFIIHSIHLRWATRSVDWVNTFPQAPPDKPTFMCTPRGFMNECNKDGCLKAVQPLCGSNFAPRNWHLHPRKMSLKLGFRECPFDKCLFHQPRMLIILCADNAGTAAPDKESVNNPVKEL